MMEAHDFTPPPEPPQLLEPAQPRGMSSPATTAIGSRKRLNAFERDLSLWVGLCMVVGVAVGSRAPALMQGLRGLEFGSGSHINVPIAVLIWLMITPIMIN